MTARPALFDKTGLDMSDTYGTTGTDHQDDTRELGAVEVFPGREDYGFSGQSGHGGTTDEGSTKDVAKDEAKATGEQAKEGARHVAEVSKNEVKNVAQETSQQAKELWQQTRTQLMDQSAQQQTRVAEGLRSLSEELSGMARGSEQQGVASDLANQASQRMGDVAGWLDQRDPGSLVSEVKQFARQRPGTFLATAALVGLLGGRLSRGLVADHQDEKAAAESFPTSTGDSFPASTGTVGTLGSADVSGVGTPPVTDHSTAGYSAYSSPVGTGESPR